MPVAYFSMPRISVTAASVSSPLRSSITRQRMKSADEAISTHSASSPSRPARRFLLVVLERSGRAGVHDKPHVRSIDAHPERHGGDDDVDAFREKAS